VNVFFVDFFEKLFGKNENWTFLKMSKSEKISRELEFEKSCCFYWGIYLYI